MLIGELALIMAAFFTGAAFYIGFAEQPARLKLESQPLLKEWLLSYQRGFKLQAPLAVTCGAAGLAAFFLTHQWGWIVGAGLILANMPFTIVMMMPLNRKLSATSQSNANAETVQAITKWGSLHNVRTLLGALATAFYLIALQ